MSKLLALVLFAGSIGIARADGVSRYEVALGPKAEVLAIEAVLAPGASDELTIGPGADRFVRGLEVGDGREWHRAKASGERWIAPSCSVTGCHIRYHFLLGDAADLGGASFANRQRAVLIAPPRVFLIRPVHAERAARFLVHFDPPPGLSAVAGWPLLPASDRVYQTSDDRLATAPPIAFGPLDLIPLDIRGGIVEVAIAPDKRMLSDAGIAGAVRSAAQAVAGWLGRAPFDHLPVLVLPDDGARLHAELRAGGGAELVVRIGRSMSAVALAEDDGILRELVRALLPSLPAIDARLTPGLVAYLTPIARARAGQLSPEAAFGTLLADHSPTTRFWLLADLRARQESGGRRTLADALALVADEGGDAQSRWTIDRLLRTCDRAVGAPIFTTLYGELDEAPLAVDRDRWWQRLGIVVDDDGTITLDDSAPLASIRRALTARNR